MDSWARVFAPTRLNQPLLLPPSLDDWLAEDQLARFLVDVVETLDLSSIYSSYDQKDARGQSAYAPAMMLGLLLYSYAKGTYSSRRIQTKT
jgi:transposase